MKMKWFIAVLTAFALVACEGKHGHDHDDHNEHEHDDHAHGDDDHAHDDEHAEREKWTHFGAWTQVYTEFDSLHVGEPAKFHVHVTKLSGWLAMRDGTVEVTLKFGDAVATSQAVSPGRPGIFEVELTPPAGAVGEGEIEVVVKSGDRVDAHSGHVHLASAAHDHDHEEGTHAHEEPITFLLEQQWSIAFGMSRVEPRRVRKTFEAYGRLRAPLGGEGVVHAPVGGRVVGDELPMLGSTVEKDQELAWLVPALADQGDLAGLELARSKAQTELRAAQSDRRRLEGLVRDGVVPERRLIDAKFAEEQAQAAYAAARRRMGQARGASGSKTRRGQGSVALRAPMTGVVVAVDVPPGLYVDAGHALFQIVDPDPLWLEVAIPEAHVPRLPQATGVWFEVEGFPKPFEVTQAPLWAGGVVDAVSRTLPLMVEVRNPEGALKPGMFADVRVITGEQEQALAVPVESVIRVDGLDVAFVGIDGETFERRAVRLGARDGEHVEVQSGIEEGEWVVTDGSFAIRLAALGDQAAGHGHSH